jgi:glycosyltransferase involved in cell wall biosynthesis
LRVLLLADSLPNGGKERQMALLAGGLPASWQRRVCALGGGPFEAHLRAKGIAVDVHRRGARLDPLPAAALWRSIMSLRPDVVHSWGWMSTLVAGPLCRLLRVPLIDGTIRTGALQPEHLWLKRIGMACATAIVANTRAGAQAWSVDPARVRVVYNGFDWSRLAQDQAVAQTAVAPADPAAAFGVVMIGRMMPAKDFKTVIAAARLLRGEQRSYRFLLVGHGTQKDELISEAASLVADGTVTFPEASLEVLDYVRQAQVGVLMTDPEWAREGCSNAIMEYMACGLPVVCSEGGGNREVVEDGKCGFVIPPANPKTLARSIAYLRDHEVERRAMGEAGRQRVAEVFSLERMVADYVHIYEEALSG